VSNRTLVCPEGSSPGKQGYLTAFHISLVNSQFLRIILERCIILAYIYTFVNYSFFLSLTRGLSHSLVLVTFYPSICII